MIFLAEIVMGNPPVVPEVGMSRIELDRTVEVHQRTRGVAPSPEHFAAIGERMHIVGIGLEHRRAALDALLLAAPVVVRVAPLAQLCG
ncbi:hypothetical protein ABH973_006299 [Bradyrhizobium ottawaense]